MWKKRLIMRARQIVEKREKKIPTVPFLLEEELETNPFLRAENGEEFKNLREERNIFSVMRPYGKEDLEGELQKQKVNRD